MTAFLADGDPPSDRTTRVLTPHTEGHTCGRFADTSRVDKTLVPIETLHGTQPAVEVSVAAEYSAPIDHRSNNPHHEHQPMRSSSVILPFAIDIDFRNDFNAFYDEFIKSPTYARAHSNDNHSSIDTDNDADDDDATMETPDATMTATHRLRLALRELEKVNRHLSNILEKLPLAPDTESSPATTVPPSPMFVDDTQQPALCPEPPRDCAPQYVLPRAPPPAPDPVPILMQQKAPIDDSCLAPAKPPHAPLPATTGARCRTIRHSQPTVFSIPNWAKPAVPHPTPMIGVVYAGQTQWPPPRPPKSAPFKKKPQIKPALVARRQEKDSLRPP